MTYKCEVLVKPVQPALVVRTRTPVAELPQVLGRVYQAVAQYLGEMGEQASGPPYVAYFNMDMQDLDIEIGFPVSKRLVGKGEIKAGEIPGGKQATCLYTGAYSEIGPAYEALMKWIAEQGYETEGVSYEYYLNDPTQTPSSELMTQIMFPLRAT